MTSARGRTLFDKIWESHTVPSADAGSSLLYIDRCLVHEGSFHAFENLQSRHLTVHRPHQVTGFADHYAPTRSRRVEDAPSAQITAVMQKFSRNMRSNGISAFDLGDERQGIVHVVAPELAISQPGMTIVCNDSHTSTHGAVGALAFGIGQSQLTQVLATQTLWIKRPPLMRILVHGVLPAGVHAKDIALFILAQVGASGCTGFAVEYAGNVVESLTLEGRLTLCNMAIESGARCALVAPDEVTLRYLHGRPFAPAGSQWDDAVAYWRTLKSDPDAHFDQEVSVDASHIAPMVTWGTSPDTALPIDASVPDPRQLPAAARSAAQSALDYMGLTPGTPLDQIRVDRVFIGSCTNARIEDLRAAAAIANGRRSVIPAMIVPGSESVRRQAATEGLDRIFLAAGFDWRHAGCSMCVGMNGDIVAPGERCASTSNRNFVGRQGPNARTHLMSPAMAAAAAVTGRLTDVRTLEVRP